MNITEFLKTDAGQRAILDLIGALELDTSTDSGHSYSVIGNVDTTVLYALGFDIDPAKHYECANCGNVVDERHLNREINDFHQRVSPEDEAVPSGECNECGALVYPLEPPQPKPAPKVRVPVWKQEGK